MIPVGVFRDQSVAVFGLGGSGFITAQALVAGGASVYVWDDNEHAREKARAAGLRIENLASVDWRGFSALVLSPGVPLTHPAPHWTVVKAREAGVEVIGDIELFCRERRRIAPDAPLIAITGTNGKSTTTALIAHLFATLGFDVQIGGNIGTPILALEPPSSERVHVVECSSYQIDLAPSLDPTVGVLLNVTPDHLDRHGTMENYAAIKARLVSAADHAVIGVDDAFCAAIAKKLRAEGHDVIGVSAAGMLEGDGVVFEGGALYWRGGRRLDLIADLSGVGSLRGAHNGQNAAASVAVLHAIGLDGAGLAKGLRSFAGLAHRMEEVGKYGKALLVNDSKATNADAAEKALLSFDNIFWILGGRAKQGGIESLKPLFGKIAKGYLIGEASHDFAKTIGDAFPVAFCQTLENALPLAARDAIESARAEPVVLLSPACASFDQFPDFEKRGDRFCEIARALIKAY
ncbi:UDP-N-acetylmuramoylalanine/D-glutamate ligase [Methylocella silvestris BL2]|uniref:UDP-N-acetylmuramoylalanine--D-glutamate ligase n=1 Tax=Methylocella silvestris (strain DSM 15510 / CIP 108128 / LMG 27833 / NCIMB 13906 / BL2) TaxID=395965 RepID=B8ETM0_METSB|nr:UDP-N-acetylmuramoyl-L-alanine--D-glutamate ligase [Methylocella silvestris]ACK52372.1 UDP-N-acetylmuramoylalanine/D-glutamate ligase [Methylocella silvestris BL2]